MSRTREIHIERLIGRKIRDPEGKPAGAIEEIEAEFQGGDWVVTRVLTGPIGLLSRLSSLGPGAWLLGLLGARKLLGGYEIPWKDMNLDDPEHPRLRCPVSKLRKPEAG